MESYANVAGSNKILYSPQLGPLSKLRVPGELDCAPPPAPASCTACGVALYERRGFCVSGCGCLVVLLHSDFIKVQRLLRARNRNGFAWYVPTCVDYSR